VIPVYEPMFTEQTMIHAKKALDSGWISSTGGYYLERVPVMLQEELGVKYVLLTSSGTTAMHLVAKCLEYKYPEKHNLIVPNNVYVAAWNAFLYNNHFRLSVMNINSDTWNQDFSDVSMGSKLRTIEHWSNVFLIVHNLGNIVNVPYLKKKYPKAVFVEDACESFGGKYSGISVGSASLCSGLSFYGNKNITSGEGGAFLTNDEELYNYAKKLHGQGQSNKKFIHDTLGYNYRMTNLQAAILYGQLLDWPEIKEKKEKIFSRYRTTFENMQHVVNQKICSNTVHSNWMFGLKFLTADSYDHLKVYFESFGIDTRPMFYPINKHTHLKKIMRYADDTAVTLSNKIAILPSYPNLTEKDQGKIIDAVSRYV